MNATLLAEAGAAVIRVGDERGFVIEHERQQYVVTAAHCLPYQPVVHGEPGWGDDPIYGKILAPLGCEPTVWAECVFADPVSDIAVLGQPDVFADPDEDIAVLGQPDDQPLEDEAAAFDALLEPVTPLKIAAPGKEGWLLSLDGTWFRCSVNWSQERGPLWFSDLEGKIVGGMSGSPIVSPEGMAIGVVSLSGSECPNPSLFGNLPGWLLGLPGRPSPPAT